MHKAVCPRWHASKDTHSGLRAPILKMRQWGYDRGAAVVFNISVFDAFVTGCRGHLWYRFAGVFGFGACEGDGEWITFRNVLLGHAVQV